MTSDMTCKEYAYLLLAQHDTMLQSNLEKRLLEVYREQCVDCLLRELREDNHIIVQPVYYPDRTDYLLYLQVPEGVER